MAIKVAGNTVINDSREVVVEDKIIHAGDSDTHIEFATDTISFDVGGAETFRANSTGDFLYGKTARDATTGGVEFRNNDVVIFTRPDGLVAQFRRGDATSNQQMIQFYGDSDGNTVVGAISVSATNTTYATTSDYRLKENVISISDGLNAIEELNPVYFSFINSAEPTQAGFIAHEFKTIIPQGVVGEKDEVDESGNPIYQSLDASYAAPFLVAAVQELSQRLSQAEAAIAMLEAQ